MEKKGKFVPTKEQVEKVLYLDCRKEIGVRRLKKSLMKLPFIHSAEDVTTDEMEEKIKKIEVRNMIQLSYVMRSIVDGEDVYSGMLKMEGGKEIGRWVKTIYGQSFWEVSAKTLFFMYYFIEDEKRKARNRGRGARRE